MITMEEALRVWLVESGFHQATPLEPMRRGLGGAGLWSFAPSAGQPPLVVRVFADAQVAEREHAAMVAAGSGGVPVPEFVMRGVLRGQTVHVLTFLPGAQVADVLKVDPGSAFSLGVAMGQTLAGLNGVPAPSALRDRPWLAAGGPSLEPLRSHLALVSDQDRLLHLDYHPANVLTQHGRITGVVDWENARAGPPHIDLARTTAVLHALALGALGERPTGSRARPVADLQHGLAEGHAALAGRDPHPALSTAWGLVMTVEDLRAQLEKPGSPIDRHGVERLAGERDRAIDVALGDA